MALTPYYPGSSIPSQPSVTPSITEASTTSGGGGGGFGMALGIAGLITSIGGGIAQGISAKGAANYNAKMLEIQGQQADMVAMFNAAVARVTARAIRTSADIDIARQAKAKEAFAGTQRASYASYGVKLEGSPLEVIIDSATEFSLDMIITNYNAKTAMSQQEFAAQQSLRGGRSAVLLTTAQANQQRAMGSAYERQGYTSSISSAFQTAAGFYK